AMVPPAAMGNLPADHPPIDANGPMPGAGGTMADTAVPTANGSDLKWSAPPSWEATSGHAMRKGSYKMKAGGGDADISITAFPGATGGLEANLNRWRGQVGMDPLPPAEVTTSATRFESNGLSFTVVDYRGSAGHMLGAIVPFGGNSWFFKLTGPDPTVVAAKPVFLEFLHTVKAP
ncbi:MAG: hypothetical protein ACHQ5A_06135, partial [Opitutales bacterium]